MGPVYIKLHPVTLCNGEGIPQGRKFSKAVRKKKHLGLISCLTIIPDLVVMY